LARNGLLRKTLEKAASAELPAAREELLLDKVNGRRPRLRRFGVQRALLAAWSG